MNPKAPAKPSRPYRRLPVSAAPRGIGTRRIATTPNSSAEASANRIAAPQKGASSWLLNRTATPFTPPSTTIAMKATTVDRSGVHEIASERGGRRTCGVYDRWDEVRTQVQSTGVAHPRESVVGRLSAATRGDIGSPEPVALAVLDGGVEQRRRQRVPLGRPASGRRRTLGPELRGRPADRLEYRLVARAATEVAGEGIPDRLIRGIRIGGQQRRRRDEHARRAEPALDASCLQEGSLEGVEVVGRAETRDRCHRAAGGLQGEVRAGVHRLSVDEDHAGTALGIVTAFLRTDEAQVVAKEAKERPVRLHAHGICHSVDGHRERHHRRVRPADGLGLAHAFGYGLRHAHQTRWPCAQREAGMGMGSPAARLAAAASARVTTTRIIASRYPADARTSPIGLADRAAASPASRSAALSGARPARRASAAGARTTVGATAVSAIRASRMPPAPLPPEPPSSTSTAVAPTTAISMAPR